MRKNDYMKDSLYIVSHLALAVALYLLTAILKISCTLREDMHICSRRATSCLTRQKEGFFISTKYKPRYRDVTDVQASGAIIKHSLALRQHI